MKIQVLDKGHVDYVSHMGNDLTVVNAARVSFNKESKELTKRDEKLITYLAQHNHWTPFAHPQITLRIKAPIFVRAQLGKHQVGFVMNEVSRRYVKDEPEFYIPQFRGAPTDGAKQGSSDFISKEDAMESVVNFTVAVEDAKDLYNVLIARGIAPEQARSILPQTTYTEWWWTGSLAAWARVYAQRIEAHSQWETQQFAKAINEIVFPLFPLSWQALTSSSHT